MNSKVEQPNAASSGDIVKYALALLLVAAGVFAFYWFADAWPGALRGLVVFLGLAAGAIELPKDKEMVMPGDNVTITVKLIAPIAMEEGLRFAIREGGRTVGAGVVAKIVA